MYMSGTRMFSDFPMDAISMEYLYSANEITFVTLKPQHSTHRFGCSTACYKFGFFIEFCKTRGFLKPLASENLLLDGCLFVIVVVVLSERGRSNVLLKGV